MSSLLVSRRARFLAAAVATGALVVGAGSPAMAADHSMQPAPSGSGECSPGLVDGTTAPMYAHFEKAHLERSPAQQVSDAQKTDDYLLLHTVWIENFTAAREADVPVAMMIENPNVNQEIYDKVRAAIGLEAPAGGIVHIAGETPKPFFGHIEHAHLQRSPGQQLGDLRATDDYLLLHTVWAESMLQPTIDVVDGSPCQ